MSDMSMRGVVDLGALAAARKQQAASEAAKANAPAGTIIDVTDASFEVDVMQRSTQVPVILDFWATWCGPCKQLSPILERVTASYGGRVVLAKIDSDLNPGLSQAFRIQSIPSVFAVIAGQPIPLFQGAVAEAQVRQVFDKVLEAAAQSGVKGMAGEPMPEGETVPADEPQEDPRFTAIYEALAAGQFDVAKRAAQALVEARDPDGPGIVAYVAVMQRQASTTEALARAAFAAAPQNLPSQLAVSDFDFFTAGPAATYERLIAALRTAAADDKALIRDRLLEFFAIDGPTPETTAARKAMTAALF